MKLISRIGRGLASFRAAQRKTDWVKERLKWNLFAFRLRREHEINLAFDRKFGTDTAAEITLEEAGVPAEHAARGQGVYRPFWTADFRRALSSVGVRHSDFTFVDIGSGKGKLLLLASDYPFKRIEGVEYAPALHAAARANVERYRHHARACSDFNLILGDALDYRLPSGPVVCLIFNSFDQATTRLVLRNLERQAAEGERPVYIIYANLRTVAEIGDVLDHGAELKPIKRHGKYIVLANSVARAGARRPYDHAPI